VKTHSSDKETSDNSKDLLRKSKTGFFLSELVRKIKKEDKETSDNSTCKEAAEDHGRL